MRPLFLGMLALLGAACSADPDDEAAEGSEAGLVDSRWIGTYRNDAAKQGELRTLSLKGNGTAAVVLQECGAATCASVESTGTYEIGKRETNGERRLDLSLGGGKKLAYRTRLNRSSFTVDAQSLSLLALDPASGAAKSPIVTFDLPRSEDLWCRSIDDCNLQSVRREQGPAVACVARMCSWDRSSVCTPSATSDPLVVEPSAAGAPSGRMSAAGAWVGDRMFVFGGRAPSNTLLADGGLYDPASNTWTALGGAGVPSAREHARAAGVPGKAVVVGGWLAGFADATDAFAYDVAAKTWAPIAIPPAVAADWHGDLLSAGGAIFRQGKKSLLHRVDPSTRTVTTVADPPELADLVGPGGALNEHRLMAVATPSSVVVLAPHAPSASHLSGIDHREWRLFEYTPASSTWSVADVGLGPIDTPTTIAYASGSLVVLSGDNPRTGGNGIVAVVDMWSKKAHVTSIGGGAVSSSAGWLAGYGGATGDPAFVILESRDMAFDTLDVARARWVHRTPWGSPPPRPSLRSERSAEVRVWTGTELLVWGGLDRARVNGFDITDFPTHVVRYSPARCTP
ncbi:MAG: hypothetical protein KF819_34430 [Labilithrix sp.]|nr:hypothetical protein [Labilithrix sp.]